MNSSFMRVRNDAVYTARDFRFTKMHSNPKAFGSGERNAHGPYVRAQDQSEHDWAYAKRALAPATIPK